MNSDEQNSLDCKVVILGSTGVGKTSICHQFVKKEFSDSEPPTIGASFSIKTLVIGNTKLTMQIWDTAGQDRFASMAPMYYRGAHAAILVFDLTSQATLDKAAFWVDELRSHLSNNIVMCLAANKSDLIKGESPLEKQAQVYAASIQSKLFKTSALTGKGVDEMFTALAEQLLHSDLGAQLQNRKQKRIDRLYLEDPSRQDRKGSKQGGNGCAC